MRHILKKVRYSRVNQTHPIKIKTLLIVIQLITEHLVQKSAKNATVAGTTTNSAAQSRAPYVSYAELLMS